MAAELEVVDPPEEAAASEHQQAAQLEADSSQELQARMEALQRLVQSALTELRSRSQEAARERSTSRLKVCASRCTADTLLLLC